jgi:2-oxoglutarate ferredoxin oxidoreductase subunit gamma
MARGYEVTWVPDTGPQGGEIGVLCTVILARGEIGSPLVSVPDAALVLTPGARDRLFPTVKPGGLLVEGFLVEGSLRTPASGGRDDVRVVPVPARREAREGDLLGMEALILVGAFAHLSGLVEVEDLAACLEDSAPREALRRGGDYVRQRRYMKERYALSIFPC